MSKHEIYLRWLISRDPHKYAARLHLYPLQIAAFRGDYSEYKPEEMS